MRPLGVLKTDTAPDQQEAFRQLLAASVHWGGADPLWKLPFHPALLNSLGRRGPDGGKDSFYSSSPLPQPLTPQPPLHLFLFGGGELKAHYCGEPPNPFESPSQDVTRVGFGPVAVATEGGVPRR